MQVEGKSINSRKLPVLNYKTHLSVTSFRLVTHDPQLTTCSLLLIAYLCDMKILMVCLGNICRSPLAEGVLKAKILEAGLSWQVDSAGTNGYHTGEAPHPLSQKIARLNGIDICTQRKTEFTAADFDRYDKIYAMAGDVLEEIKLIAGKKFNPVKVDLFLNELFPGENIDVPDPYYGPEQGYHDVYRLINDACDAVINRYSPIHPGNYRDQQSTFKQKQ